MFKCLPENNLFVDFVLFIKTNMNSNYFAKKIISWFNENIESNKEREFGFRFHGRESFNYLQGFPLLICTLKPRVNKQSQVRLTQVFHQLLCLRKLISYSVRIEDTEDLDPSDMISTGRALFKCCSHCMTLDLLPVYGVFHWLLQFIAKIH